MRRRLHAAVAAPGITLDQCRQQFKKAVLGGIDMPGQASDFIAKFLVTFGDK